MSKLTLMLDGKYIREYSIEDDVTTIGRRSSNTISTDSSDLAVSGTHARIVFILDEHFIEDLESTNGTYVNGKPIKKHNLREGDVIARMYLPSSISVSLDLIFPVNDYRLNQ